MMIFKLAIRNILGAGLRTWLNVIVLSLAFVTIILSIGINQGLVTQISTSMIKSEIGSGQYWQANYDPYDPFSLQDAHAVIPGDIEDLIEQKKAVPVLLTQGTIYPQGRIMPVFLKGIPAEQAVLQMPSAALGTGDEELPALVGARMAKSAALNLGDTVTLRWRDKNGTFDAKDAVIVHIMNTTVGTIDNMQVWLPLTKLQEMMGLPGEASLVIVDENIETVPEVSGWDFKDQDFLLKDFRELIKTRAIARSIFYVLLLFVAVIAIFDTQFLSIFERRKEIGTLISLGMTKAKVIQLFTLEGALHGFLAALVGAAYGIPLINYLARRGIDLPQSSDSFGLALGHTLYPTYSTMLVLSITVFILIVVTIVSYLPTRNISKLNPTDALRGRL